MDTGKGPERRRKDMQQSAMGKEGGKRLDGSIAVRIITPLEKASGVRSRRFALKSQKADGGGEVRGHAIDSRTQGNSENEGMLIGMGRAGPRGSSLVGGNP